MLRRESFTKVGEPELFASFGRMYPATVRCSDLLLCLVTLQIATVSAGIQINESAPEKAQMDNPESLHFLPVRIIAILDALQFLNNGPLTATR